MASGGTGLMHESYWFEDSSVYTRFWFAMANSYMGEALLDLAEIDRICYPWAKVLTLHRLTTAVRLCVEGPNVS